MPTERRVPAVRHDRVWALLTLALLNVFVLAAGLVTRDVIAARPPETVPLPVAHAESVPDPAATDATTVDPVRLADKLDDPMERSGISEGLYAYVADASTHEELYARDGSTGAVPASTTKVATAVAALHAVGPQARIDTEVARGSDSGEIVLVGGGDPTLTEEVVPGDYPRVATLEELAAATADALEEADVDSVRLGYDDSAYSGDTMAPGWKQGYVDEGSTAPAHALMIDGGRTDRTEQYPPRVADPPLAAAEAFARQLGEAGITVEGPPRAVQAADGAETLAGVRSAPVFALVEFMMLTSDNNVAEALARQVALAGGEEPSFAGAATATQAVMAELGVDGVRVSDGSGLSVDNRISPRALVDLLLLAADPERPDLYHTLSGLPTANSTGSLDDRYFRQGSNAAGAGLVRAKTGTLNGVSALAGTAYDADGRLLVFAFVSNNPGALSSALDTFATVLAECGCS